MSRLVAFAAILLVLVAIAARGERTDDLSSLLPSEGALAEAAGAVTAGRLAVVIEVDRAGSDTDALRAAVGAIEEAARDSGRFAAIRARVDPVLDGRAIHAIAVRHAVSLLPAEVLRERTSEAGVAAAIRGWRARLAGPASAMAARGMQEDPLDLGGLVVERLRASTGTWAVRPEEGLLLDPTGGHALILGRVTPEAAADPALPAAMDAVVAASPLPARWFGGPRVAADSARSVQRDVAVSSALGVALLALVLAVGLRNARAVLALALPLGAVVAAIGATLALRSPIHGISLGFGGALVGIAADYWIHLHVAAARRYAGPDPARRREAAHLAWREIAAPLATAAGTTVAAFALMLLSRYPVVRDLAASGIAAILAAYATTGLVGPVVFGWTGGRDAAWSPPAASPTVARAAVAGFAVLALLATGVRWDGDPRNLVAVSPDTVQIERDLAERYGGVGTGGVVLAPDADTAAEASAVLREAPGVTVSSPDRLLPGPRREAEGRAALPPPEVLAARVAAAASAAGFHADALLPGIEGYYRSAPVSPATWDGTPFAEVLARAVTPAGVVLDVVLADPAVADAIERRLPPGARLVVPARLASRGVVEIRDELARLGGLAALAVLAILVVRYRAIRPVIAAATPVAAALAGALGGLAILGWPLDAVGTSVLVLVLGLSVDYGIFLADGDRHATAVGLSALTSIAGFGTMIASRSAGLASAGLVVSLGLGAAVVAALLVSPHVIAGTLVGPRGRRVVRAAAVAGVVAINLQLLVLVRFVAAPPPVAVPPPAPLPGGDDRRIGADRLVRTEGVWALSVAGTPAEMGAAHGRLAADLRARLEGETLDAFARAVPNPLGRAAILELVLLAGAGLDRHVDPRWREELAGLVASTPDPRAWTLPGYTRKLYFHALHDIGQALVDSPLVGCTGFLATGPATADGHTILARNFDFEGGRAFDDDKVVIVRRPASGHATVSVAFPGMVGVVSGMNEHGIALALQAAGSDHPIRLAEPMTLVLREALEEARSLDEVAAVLDRRRGFATELVLAADGRRGEAAVFEVTPERVERLPAGSLLAVSNHLRSAVFADDAENARRQRDQTTVPRLERMTTLVEAERGRLDLPTAARILRDRGEGLPRGHRHAIDADLASHAVIFDATAGTVWVSVAPNLAGGFVAFELSDLLAGELAAERVVAAEEVGEALRTHRARDLVRAAAHLPDREAEALLREALRHRPDHPEVLLALAERVRDPAERRSLVERVGIPENAADRARLEALR